MRKVLRYLPAANITVLILAAIPAGAVSVGVNSSIVFHDGFESGNFNSPTGGVWNTFTGGVSVTNAVFPGPAEGSFYAQLDGTGGGSIAADLTSTISSGDVVLRMMVYIPSASDGANRARFGLLGAEQNFISTARAWVQTDGSGNILAIGPGLAPTTSFVHYALDVWQEWDLEYLIGGSTFSLTVNGVTQSGLSSLSSGPIGFASINNDLAAPGSIFVDAVPAATTGAPEPATLGCGISGLALLLWRKRRSR